MKIALAQINPTVGDIAANSAKIKRYIRQAAEQGAELSGIRQKTCCFAMILSMIISPPWKILPMSAVIVGH